MSKSGSKSVQGLQKLPEIQPGRVLMEKVVWIFQGVHLKEFQKDNNVRIGGREVGITAKLRPRPNSS